MPMDVFVSSCVCDTCKLQLIQYSCVKIYYSILPYPVDQTTSSPPACLRSLPVLAAARMTHSSKHTIGETFDSIHTCSQNQYWLNYTSSTKPPRWRRSVSNTGNYLDHSWVIGKPVYLFDNCLQDNQIMQEIVNTCIDICTIVFIIASTISVTLLSIILIVFKNLVITQEFKDHIKMIKQLRESAWESELPADT